MCPKWDAGKWTVFSRLRTYGSTMRSSWTYDPTPRRAPWDDDFAPHPKKPGNKQATMTKSRRNNSLRDDPNDFPVRWSAWLYRKSALLYKPELRRMSLTEVHNHISELMPEDIRRSWQILDTCLQTHSQSEEASKPAIEWIRLHGAQHGFRPPKCGGKGAWNGARRLLPWPARCWPFGP